MSQPEGRVPARHRRAIRGWLLVAAMVLGQLPAMSPQTVLAASNYSSAILSDAPSGYWRLGELSGTSATDATTHTNTLTYQGGFTLGIPGSVKGDPDAAAGFNGTTAVATETKTPLTAVANWTLEAWVNPSTLPQLGIIAYNGIKDTSQGGYGLAIGTVSFTSGSKLIGILGSVATIDSGYSFAAPNQWYHVVMTRDASTIRFYVNGKQTPTTSTAAPTAPGARFSIGAGVNVAGAAVNGLAGTVDEAAIYPTALSAGRISAHYQEGASATSGLGNWATQSPTGPPSIRFEPAMGWDAGHNKVVLFGGQSSAGAAIQDTWTWNGAAWTKLTPATQPSARWGASLVYDTALNKMVLFGGTSGSKALSDTWTWDGTTWASISPGTVPPARYEYGLAYDKTNSVVVMFGGFTKTAYLQDTYTFNGTNWTLKSPAAKPTTRARVAMDYQDSNNRTVLFGGVNGTTYNAETWLWDGSNWTLQAPNAAPSARADSGLAYDPITLTSVLIGGVNGTSYFADTWTWDGSNWSQQKTSTSPAVRAGAGFAYNGVTFNGALFGGLSGSTYLGDTLAWNTPPAAPTAVTAIAGNGQATITWTAPANGGLAITGYKIVPYAGTTAGTTTSVGATPTSATVSGLSNGTAYTFTVAATSATGTGPVATSNAVTPATVPGAPTSVTATCGNAQATVSWTAPASNGGAAITGYTVTPYVGATAGTPVSEPATPTSATLTSLVNGTTYTFTVKATNSVGTGAESAQSNATTCATVPGAPTNVTATGGNAQATVTWTAPSSNGGATITGYTITPFIGPTAGTPVNEPATPTGATVSSLQNGSTYTFTVKAINTAGTGAESAHSNAVNVGTVPGAPTNVVATAGNGQASVSWTAPASNGGFAITGYTITPYIGTTAGTPMGVSGTTTSATVSGLTNCATYTFQVTATNSAGIGPAGTSNAVLLSPPPGAPTNVVAVGANASGNVTWTPPTVCGPITGYTITPYVGSSPGTSVPAGANATSATVLNLQNGTTYTLQITATNAIGTGPAGASNPFTPATVPQAPGNVAATAGNAQATVTWTAPANNGSAITGYTITPYIGSTGGTPVGAGASATSLTIGSLFNGTTYTFQVTATNGVGTSAAATSNAVMPTGPPYTPTNVVATGGNAQATVTWTAPGNGGSAITSYTVTPYVGATPGTPFTTPNGTTTTATMSPLINGTTYTFQVVATSALGSSAPGTSNPITPATVPQPPGSVNVTGGDSQASVTWTVPTNGGSAITGYIVTPYIGTSAGTPVNAGPSATSTTVTGLVNGTTYTFQVVATNALGNSSAATSSAVTVGTPPGPPTNVTATAGNAQATVSWNAPSNNGGLAISSYTVTPYIGTTAGTPVTTNGTTTTKTVTSLNNGVTYTFQVTATSTLGTSTAGTSNAATPSTVPDAPGSVTATGAIGQATVSWTAPANGGAAITGYTITPYVGTTAGTPASADASATSTIITGLVNGTTYTFQVVAANVAGNSAPGTSNAVTVGAAPGPPSGVTATPGNAQATVTWTAPASNGGSTITGYTVTPYIGSTAGTPVNVDGTTTTGTVTALVNGTTYTFQVTGTNAIGTSAAGVSNAATPATIPQAPGNVAATAGNTQAIATWTAPANGGSAITGYTVTPFVGTTAGTPVSLGASATSATLTGLINGTTYTFQVFATNAVGNSAPGTSNAVTLGLPPGPPTNVAAASGNAQATITWLAPASNGGLTITGYTVTPYIGSTAGTPVTVGGTTLTATVTGLTNGTSYTFQVYATNAMGNGPATASNVLVVGTPAAPTSVAATGGANQATVSWTAPASNGGAISGYIVQAYVGSQAQNAIAVGGTVVTATLSGLQGGVAYTFQVAAANSFGNGPSSSATAAVTPSGSATTYASTVLGNAPSLFYRLGDPSGTVAADSSGSGIAATYNGNAALGGAGVVLGDPDHAVVLDGGSAYISAPTNQALQGDNTRTVELWFKTTSASQQMLFDSGNTGANGQAFEIALTQQNGVGNGPPQNTPGVYLGFWNTDVYLPGLSLSDGAAHYIAVTLSGSTLFVYVDGQLAQGTVFNGSTWTALSGQPFTLGSVPNTAGNPIWIGHGRQSIWGNGSSFFSGTIDEAAIYPFALSAAQVNAHVLAAGYLLAAATNVVATAGANQATVTWTAPTTASSATSMLVTAYLGAQPVNSVGLAPTTTSVTITGLQGGSAYTFTVVTSNGFGASPTATSNAVTPTGSASTYASTVLSDSPSIYYRLGDPSGTLAADSSGNARNANYQSTPYTLGVGGALVGDSDPAVTITPNCCNFGQQFGGSEVQYRFSTGLPVANAARSVEVWVKTGNFATEGLAGWGNTGSLQAFQLALVNGNQVTVTSGANDTPLAFTSPTTIANGAWHLITVTYDGTTLTVYLDGLSLGTGTFSGALATSSSTISGLILGHYFWCGVGCNQYNGSLDEVAIYGSALSSTQVATHFNASGNGRPTAPTAVTATPGANQATVSWTASTASTGSPVAGYLVTANLNGTQPQNAVGVGGTSTSATISGLQGGATYTFTVTAYNSFGYGPTSASAGVTPTGSASTYVSTVLGDSPSIYYRLGDPSGTVAADSSGGARNAGYQSRPFTLGVGGALVGDADTSVTIQSDCCNFGQPVNGSEVQYKLTAGLPSSNASRSVEVWVNSTNFGTQGLVGWGNTGGLQAFQLTLLNGNQISVTSGANDTPLVFTSSYAIANGSWHLITATYNGTTLTVYLDGQSIGNGTFSGALATSPTTAFGLILGHYFWCGVGCNQYNGSLDEVAIYNSALNAQQVAAHFNASGDSRPTAPGAVTATAGANQASVTWTASTASAGAPVSGYVVTASLNGTQSQNAVGVDGNTTSATITGLEGGAVYTFSVTAYNNFGYGSASAASASVTTTGNPSSYASTVLGDSPSIYYRLGDPTGTLAADSSGNGRNANYQSKPYTLAVGGALVGDSDPAVTILSDCCQFGQPVNGSEVQDKLAAGVPTGNSARSIEVWVKTTNMGTQGLVGWGITNTHQMFQLRLVAGNQIQLVSWGDDPTFTSGYTIANGSWHLITVTYDGTTLTAYVDGLSLGTATFSGALASTFNPSGLVFGHEVWGGVGSDQFNGSLDEVAIYGAALSSSQVAAHFSASGNSRPTAPTGVGAIVGANQATVSWTAATASAGSPITGYVITANLNGTQSRNAIGVGVGTSTLITGLQGGANYTFTVTAYNNFGYGPGSAPSAGVTTTGLASTYTSTVIAASPSIYYRLGDPAGTLAADSSGNGRNGYYQSTPYALGVGGALTGDSDPAVTIQSGCCYFGQPTGGSEVQYKLPAGLPSGNAPRSIEVWAKTTNTGTQGLVGWGITNTHQMFQLRLVGGNQIQLVTWGDDRNFTAASPIADGFWHLIVVTYDGTTLAVYLDGQNLGTTSFSGALATTFNANGLILGHDVWGGVGSDQFNGSLDEVAIYATVLTSTQITAHYAASGAAQGFPGAPTAVSATGGVNQATVSWTAPSSSGGSSISSYTVVPHVGTTLRTPMTVSGTTTSTVVTGLSGGTTYYFTVNAANASGAGLDSAASNVVTPTGTVYPYSGQVLGDSPAGYWRLGEATGTSATDSSGNGNTGTFFGASGLSQAGAIRNDPDPAVVLDGITSYVSVRSSATLNVTGALSLEAWVNFSNLSGTQQIINKGDGATSSNTAYELTYVSGTGIVFDTFANSGAVARATWRATLQTGVWYHLVGTRTADGALALYVNGSLMGTAHDGGSPLNNINATVGLGASGVGTGSNREPLAGSLDEVAIYSSALSAAQIALHLQASANRPTAPTNVVGTATAPNQITVTWTAPSDGGSTAINGYVVTPHVGATLATPTITSSTATTAVVSGLSAGTAYFFTVSATNGLGAGAPSVPSTVVTASGTTTYPYTQTVLADGPAADWRLAETSGNTATDVSGNGNSGTYVAGDTLTQTGAIQRDPATAAKLDGVGGQVLVPNAANLNITADVTAEVWVKFNSISTNQVLISKGEGSANTLSSFQLWYQAVNGGSFVFTTFIGATATSGVYPMTPTVGTWYHVIGTRNAAGMINVWVDCNLGTGEAEDGGGLLNSTGSALAIGSAGSGTGPHLNPLNGFIQEAAVYNVALGHDRIGAHWGAAGYVPAAPTNVAATGGQNNAVVSWHAPSYAGTSPVTGYVLQAYAGGKPVSTPMSVDANTTSFNFAPIGGGFTYTFTVTAINASGACGPASAQSNAVAVTAPVSPDLGQHLAIVTTNVNPLPEGTFGYSTCTGEQCIFSDSMVGPVSQWTIEGFIWGLGSNSVTGGNTAWGLINTDRIGHEGNYKNVASASRPIAGINFDIGLRNGIGGSLQTYFVWPGGQYPIPSDSSGLPTAADNDSNGNPRPPAHFALSYDGTTVRGFINGALLFSTAASFGAIKAPAGIVDNQELSSGIFDEFRISNVARYTADFTPPTVNFNTDSNTTLLWHFDGFALGEFHQAKVEVPFDCSRPQVYTVNGVYPDEVGPHPANIQYYGTCNFNLGPEYYHSLSVGQAPTAAETRSSSGFKTTCDYTPFPVNCATGEFWHSFTDLSVPGRGLPLTLTRSYSSLHAGTSGPLGYGWTDSYNMSLSIDGSGNVTVNEENYSAVSFANVGGNLQPPPRTLATLVHNGDGTYTFTRKDQAHFNFDASGRLVSEVDRNNYATLLAYDGSNRLSTVTDPSGRSLTFHYNASGLIDWVTDPAGRQVLFTYDGTGATACHPANAASQCLISYTDVGGQASSFTYDSAHRVLTMTDPRGGIITNTYDDRGRVLTQKDQLNRLTQFAYSNGTTTITDPKGNVTVERYRDNLMLSQTKGYGTPQQATWTYTYDPVTLGVASITDPNGHVATTRYDSRGNIVGATDPMGRSASATYNTFNDPTSSIDQLGVQSTETYDANGNLKTSSRPLQGSGQSATAVFTYDPANLGDPLQMTDPNGKVWHYTYDQYGNQVSVTDALGNTATFVYDTVGRMTSSVSPNGNATGGNPANFTTTYGYNPYGDLTSVTDPLNHQTTFAYDLDGNLQSVTDANMHTSNYTYDAANQITLVTKADNSTQGFTYDLSGNLTKVQDGMQQPTNFAYDPLNRTTSMTDALNRTTSYGYDGAGRLTTATDAMNRTTSLAYDAGSELVSVTYSDGVTPNVRYAYDAMARPVSMTDGTGTSTYGYDSLHRLVQATNGAGSAVGYGYDLNGHLTTITYPGPARVVSNTYDDSGRLATVSDWLGHTTTYRYDANSNLVEQDYPNGVVASFTYDNAGRLTALSDAVAGIAFLSLAYSRDNVGQLTSENSKAFGYNTINHLTSAQIAGNQSTYTYDTADRLTQVQVAGGSGSTYVYDAADQLQSITTTQGATQLQKYTYSYDPNGNRVSRTDQSSNSVSYVFDQANRLTSFGTSAQYTYDGSGLRTQKSVGGVISAYSWNVASSLPTVLLDGQTAYVNGPGGLPVEQITSSGQVYYYHPDQLGSTRALTDSTGAVVQTYDYDAYGSPLGSNGSITNPFLYGGQYTDAESGLQYLRARYYDGSSQSFISRDPAVLLEPYSYAGSSPQTNTDPSGLDWADGGRALNDGTGGYLGYVPFLGTGLNLISAYSALRQCDFAAAEGYMAAASISMIVGVYAGVLGGVVLGDIAKAEEKAAARGEAAAERNALRSEEKALDEVYVIGRRDDTKAFIGRPGHNVLNLPDKGPGHWTERKNEIWVQSGIDKGARFKLVSPATIANIRGTSDKYLLTQFGKELRQLWNAGYRMSPDGLWMLPPAVRG